MNEARITGFVLAGGKSVRMGTDKALLIYNGKPLIRHAVEILDLVCDPVVISSGKNYHEYTGCETWPDEIPVNAAMAGIYTCLKRSGTMLNFFLSVDMPLIEPVFITKIIRERGNYDLVLPVHDDGSIEPLCGLYTKNLVPLLHQLVLSGQYSLWQLAGSCSHKLINTGKQREMFLNVNTRGDFDLLNKS